MSWLLDTTLATGALIAAVLVLRRPVARLFGPGLAYALWALPLLRLVLPPLVLPARQEPMEAVQVIADVSLPAELPTALQAAATIPAGPDWMALAIMLWLAGAATFALWRIWGYVAMRRLLLTGAVPVGQVGAVRLVESPATQAPVAFGVRDKVVALPLGFMARHDRLGRDLAIAHELEHHAGRDLAVNLAMQPLLALHWFNPLAWLGWRALRRDQEAACDARVMAGAPVELRAAYGRLIAAFAQSPRLALAAPMACPVLGEASVIHRLRSLTMSDQSPRRRLAGRAMIAAAVLALPLTASMSYAAADDLPQPPTAPDAPMPSHQHQIVIIEKHGGKHGDAGLITRVVERGGRTIVLKTDRKLSDAEVERKIEQALRTEAETPEPPQPPAAAMPPEPPMPPAAPGKVQRQMIVMRGGADQPRVRAMLDAKRMDCGSGAAVSKVERSIDGQTMAMVICADQIEARALAQASRSLAEARQRVAEDSKLSDELRRDILKDLDREIERLSRQGKS